jgi:hypothetical protein
MSWLDALIIPRRRQDRTTDAWPAGQGSAQMVVEDPGNFGLLSWLTWQARERFD